MANAVACVVAATLFSATGMNLPNLALKKPTEQSTTKHRLRSNLAVDGNNNTHLSAGLSCSHVGPSSSLSLDWWLVDLQQTFLILTVSITNRGDCCHNRLTNFTVEVHASDPRNGNNSDHQLCYWHEGTVGRGITIDLPCAVNTIGRYVRIVKYSSGWKPLTLCEVAVRGTLLHKTCSESSAAFSHMNTGARQSDCIIASHENVGKLDCANMCIRMAACNAFNAKAPSMGVVSCELLAAAPDPIKNVSWNVYTITRFQCPSD